MTTETKRMPLSSLILNVVITTIFFPAVVILTSGNWLWLEGWIFAVWFDVMVLFGMFYMYWKDPALLAERTRAPGSANQKRWDKYLLMAIYSIAILWLVVMPLDAERFRWSPAFPVWLKVTGGVLLLPALYLIESATVQNTYLSALVRIQSERRQQVISTGVYGFVRHPLYLGCLLMMIGAPLLMGSLYGLIISLIGTIAVVVRITGEEKMLTAELEGYAEYKQKVTRRLIPFIW